jgi:dTDP-4-amino-4,6-dideoxygalactose transaminase
MSTYKGKPLGTIGHMGAYSFHETKNIIAGEGGALLVSDPQLAERAEIIREKGTNRSQFFRGQGQIHLVDIGSSYLPGEVIAAFLWAQMEEADSITARRLARCGTSTTKRWPLEAARAACAVPWCPKAAPTTPICTTSCSTRWSSAPGCWPI